MKEKYTYSYKTLVGNTGQNEKGQHIIVRALLPTPVSSQECFSNIIQYKEQGLHLEINRLASIDDIEGLRQQLNRLSTYKIVYNKISEIPKDGSIFYYHQMILEGEPLHINTAFCNLFGDYKSIEKISPSMPKSIFPFMMANMELSLTHTPMSCLTEALDNELTKMFKDALRNYKENITGMFKTDISKKYNRNAMIKMTCSIYDNYVDAINDKNKDAVIIYGWDSKGISTFHSWKENRGGVYSFRLIYSSKVKAIYYNDMAVIYDSKKAFKTIEPFFALLYDSGLKNLHIMQYSGNKDFYYNTTNNNSKLILRFTNVDNIIRGKSNFGGQRWNTNLALVCIKGHKGQKNIYIESYYAADIPYRGTVIIPIKNGEVDKVLLENLMDGIGYNRFPGNTYILALKGEVNMGEDVISTWFDYCIKAKKKGTHDLLGAYMRMKQNLEDEYTTLKQYIEAYDFSKCMAIPSVKMDEKLKENYYKTLHVEPKSIIIKSIKKEKIKPIELIQPTITFMEASIKKNYILRADLPLKDYYKTKENTIELEYQRLRGDVSRVKTQNRR